MTQTMHATNDISFAKKKKKRKNTNLRSLLNFKILEITFSFEGGNEHIELHVYTVLAMSMKRHRIQKPIIV